METASTTHRSSKGGKFLSTILILGLVALVVLLDVRRREAEKRLMDLSVRYEQGQGGSQANREAAQQVVAKVRKLYRMPEGVDPTVATIVDVEQLRARNAFYEKAKNGDYLIVTSDRAILYDPVANIIVDMVPVQIQAKDQAPTGSVIPTEETPPTDQPPAEEPPAGEMPPAEEPPVDAMAPEGEPQP